MENQIDRIKEIMGIKIISENIAPVAAAEFRNFFEHILSAYRANVTRQEIDRLLKNTTRKEIKDLTKNEIEELLKKIDYESVVRTLLNKGLVGTAAKRNYFNTYINAILNNRMTVQETLDATANSKYFTYLYNASKGANPTEPVPEFVKKMEKEMNEIWLEEFEVELKRRNISVPPRTLSSQADELAIIFSDRDKLIKFINTEIESVLGKKLPKEKIEDFADELLKVINESVKKFEPQFQLIFKDLESYISKLGPKSKKEFLTKAFNRFIKGISEDTKISKTIKQKVIDYFKGGLGVKDMVKRVQNGEKLWDVYKENMMIAIGTAGLGTFAQILRSENPISKSGGLMEWGWKKYFLTIIPGINTLWGVSYAIWQTIMLAGEKLVQASQGDEYEGKGGNYSSTISIDEAKDFVMNQDGLNNLIPSGVNSSELTYKGTEKGKAIDVYYQDNYICSLIKDCKSVNTERVKDLGKCKIKIR